MTYNEETQREITRARITFYICIAVAVLGVLSLVGYVYWSYQTVASDDEITEQKNQAVTEYLNTHAQRFAGDESLKVEKRVEILTTTHALNTQQTGELEVMQKNFDDKMLTFSKMPWYYHAMAIGGFLMLLVGSTFAMVAGSNLSTLREDYNSR